MTTEDFRETSAMILEGISAARAGQRRARWTDVIVKFRIVPQEQFGFPVLLPSTISDVSDDNGDAIEVQFEPSTDVIKVDPHDEYPDSGGLYVKELFERAQRKVANIGRLGKVHFVYDRVRWRVISHHIDVNNLSVTFLISKEPLNSDIALAV